MLIPVGQLKELLLLHEYFMAYFQTLRQLFPGIPAAA